MNSKEVINDLIREIEYLKSYGFVPVNSQQNLDRL
jgi:hypothetical protein